MKSSDSFDNNYRNIDSINCYKLCVFIFMALVLTIVPFPNVVAKFRPNFLLIIVLYMQCFVSVYFRIAWVFMLGILLDVLTASTIGQHSLAFIITTWVASSKPSNFRYYSILQQTLIIFLYCVLYQLLIVLVDLFFGINVNIYESICIVLLTVALWPVLGLIFTIQS